MSARSFQYVVTPGYAEALGLRLKSGRSFREFDLTSDVRPWVVNQEFARLYLPQGVLFGVAPLDVLSFIAAPIVLAVVAVAACLLPASRAASTDPAEAPRCE